MALYLYHALVHDVIQVSRNISWYCAMVSIVSRQSKNMVQLKAWTWLALVASLPIARGAEWYENALLYQVDVATFKDGDGDGVGDILGLTQELKYIRSLGAEAVILPSLNDDLDSVTKNHDPHFDHLIAEADKIDLKVIVTLPRLVVSEFSDWFSSSANRSSDKHDIIIWRHFEPPSTPGAGEVTWVRSGRRGEYYAAESASGRACLRGAHAAVRAELSRLASGWLARGVAGLLLSPACEPAPHLATDLALLTTDYFRMHGGTKRIAIVDATRNFTAGHEYMRAGGDALVASDALLGSPDARDLKHRIDRWTTYLPTRHAPLWMTGSSVQEVRLVGIFSALALLLPGSAIIPLGSELGQGPNKPWPLDSLNAETKAHLEFFLTLVQARKTSTVESGGFEIKVLSNDVLAFVRFLEGEATFAAVLNLGQVNAEVDLSAFYGLGEEMSATRGRVRVRAARVLPGEPLLLRSGPRTCGGPGPVDKITGKLSEAIQKVNKYFNW